MTETNPRESLEAEGIPEVEDHPPGIDVETDAEGLIAPRDHPIAAGEDPAYPVTAAEQRTPESVAERAAREEPEVGAPAPPGEEPAVAGGQLVAPGGEEDFDAGDDPSLIADRAEDDEAAVSAEEAAMEVRDDDTI